MSTKTSMQNQTSQKENKSSGPRISKNYLTTFLSNRTHTIQGKRAIISGQINRNGFMGILNGGFKSTGSETMECNLPDGMDLSIKQNKGFSVFFWFVVNKPQTIKDNSVPFYIFKKGNSVDQLTPIVGLMANGTSLFIEINTSKSKKEILFCNRKLEYEHFYAFAVTFNINYEEETTEISAYLDGKLDTQSTVPGEPIHNQGNAYLGKPDSTSCGFKGTIADVILVPRILAFQEIKIIFEQGLENFNKTKGTYLYTYAIFNDLFERKKLISLYSKYTGKPIYAVENLNLTNERMKEVVKNYDMEEKKNDIPPPQTQTNVQEEQMIYNMSVFLKDENNDIITNKILDNARFINTVLYLANKGEDNFEVERVVKIFSVLSETLQFKVEEQFLVELGKNLNVILSHKVDGKQKQPKIIYYLNVKKFFKNLKKSIQTLEDRQRAEDEENAKYQTKRNKRKQEPLMIKSFYNSRRDKRAQTEENTQTTGPNLIFTDCIPYHEKLLLKSQNMKNEIDDKEEENLESYQSTFVLKSIYEKPKFLPGENPEFPKVKLVETSLNESDIKEKAEEDKEENEIDPEVREYTKIFVDQILTLATENAEVNTDIVKDENTAATIEKNIYNKKEQKRKLKEEMDRKIREAERKKNEEEKEIVTEVKAEEKNDYDPVIPEGWADGNFEVIINHCYNCHKHETTTKHYEFSFVNKFNEIGEEILHVFPNCVILGNLDEPEYLGNFDVYLRGTGLPGDQKGRYFIYKKIETLEFPSVGDVIDKLVALAIMYGNTMNIESAQSNLLKNNTTRLEITHEHPCTLSEEGEKRKQRLLDMQKKEPRIDPDYTKFKCAHWGCNAVYVQNENKGKCCQYHPGLWQFGSYNCSWPACWTCCEEKWESEGCVKGQHEGEILSKTLHLCLNHGEPNPVTKRPDWACGKYYTEKSDSGCLGHPGYHHRGKWTCCGGDKPCTEQKHATEEYPSEKAQLHFYPKYVFNPGLRYSKEGKGKAFTRGQLICASDYFDDKKVYPNAKEIYDMKKSKVIKEESMKRYCLNWGCEKRFTDKEAQENIKKNKKDCVCHPGKWDHGSTGTTMVQYINEMNSGSTDLKKNKILWKPHWSCCRGDWRNPGCTKCDHHGPLEEDLPRYGKKYIWPDERMKLMFPKIVGERWNDFVNQFRYDEAKIRKICKKFFGGQKVPISEIPKLCDKLRLYYLIVQENPEYTMKYYDVVYQIGSIDLFTSGGMCDMEKFIQWWTKGYEEIYEILHPPPKKVEPPPKEEEKSSK